MKKLLSIFLGMLLVCLQLQAVAYEGEISLEGGFTGRLLARSAPVSYEAEITNRSNGERTAILIFAKYAGDRLQTAEVYEKALPVGKTVNISETTSAADAETDRISAIWLDGVPALSPLCRSDVLREEYEPIFSQSRMASLHTQMGALPENADELAERFPVRPVLSMENDQAVINGAGLLAYFDEGGPGEVYIRTVRRIRDTPVRFRQFRTVRVIAPGGEVAAFYDFSEKDLETEEIVLRVPPGEAGIWTVSYIGGAYTTDMVTLGVPESRAWGVRGETTFRFTPETPREWYVYVPEKSTGLCKIKKGGYVGGITLYDDQNAVIEPNGEGYFNYEIIPERTGVVWRVKNNREPGSSLTSETITFATGIPGLLCPTKEMAEFLKGGMQIASDGLHMGGLFQKRVREAMLLHKDDDLSVTLDFPTDIPAEVQPENYDTEALLYGLYGGLSALQDGIAKQCLDSANPYYGAFPSESNDLTESYEGLNYSGRHSMSQTASLAAVSGIPSKLNPAYDNRALITRSMLSSFCHFAAMSPDYLIRERTNSPTQFWPMSHVFFIYPSLATAYGMMKDKVKPEEAELWRMGLILIGDKLANYTASETNQWSEIIYGHLLTYRVTGEERFLRYFERAAEAVTEDNLSCSGSLGQHSAGYFMESYAPSGSYQELSMHNLAAAYLNYRVLPCAKPALEQKLENSIRRAVEYESLYWLPQPSGSVVSPTSMNLRAPTVMMSNCGYPGMFLAAIAFPEANGLLRLLPYDADRYSYALTMPHIALNNPALAKRALTEGFRIKDTRVYSMGGAWTPRLYEAYALQERTTDRAVPPVCETERVWDLDGMLAWKKDGWYVMTHYATPATGGSVRSGLPAAVWREETGAALLSMNLAEGAEADGAAYSCLTLEHADGTVTRTGLENGTLSWLVPGESYRITQAVGADAQAAITTKISGEGLNLSVLLTAENAPVRAYASLPINVAGLETEFSEGTLTCRSDSGVLEIRCGSGARWSETALPTGNSVRIQTLEIPLEAGVESTVLFTVK